MDWRRQAVVLNGAESHNDFWRVGHGNAEWMFGTRNVPCFWLDNGVAHGCPNIRPSLNPGNSSPTIVTPTAVDQSSIWLRSLDGNSAPPPAGLVAGMSGSLRKASREYAAHYHTERNQQGIDNALIEPGDRPASTTGAIACAQRLGGMLRFYHRAAA